MRTSIQKWGNSLAIRIPKALAAELGIAQDSEVDLSYSRGRLTIAPVANAQYQLADLLTHVTVKNRHAEQDVGAAVGREVW